MSTSVFQRHSVSVLLAFLFVFPFEAQAKRVPQPEPTTEWDGPDLVVSLPVTINNSWHLAIQDVKVQENTARLKYFIVQNADWLVRSRKTVVLQWRLPNWTDEEIDFSVAAGTAVLSSQQLEMLAESLPVEWAKATESDNSVSTGR